MRGALRAPVFPPGTVALCSRLWPLKAGIVVAGRWQPRLLLQRGSGNLQLLGCQNSQQAPSRPRMQLHRAGVLRALPCSSCGLFP